MADWWENQPLAGKNSESGNWWDNSPIIGGASQAKPTAALTPPPQEEPLGPLGAGFKGMGADLRTAGAAVGTLAPDLYKGITGASPEESLDAANKIREEVARRYKPKVPSYTDIGKGGTVGDYVGDTIQYIYEKGAESLPQMGATAAAGLGAMAAAPAAVPAAVAGVAGGTLGALPFFFGQNIQEQLNEGVPLRDTSAATAAGAGVVQGALDTLIGKVLPGIGRAAAGGMILRAAKKGLEGGVIEGLTESAQQAIQIGQANPAKLWDFGPEVQKELAEAAVAGGLLGGTIGGAAGAVQKRSSPQEVEVKTEDAIPPATEYKPMGTGLPGPDLEAPGLDSGTGLPEYNGEFKKVEGPVDWFADKTGLPFTYQRDASVLFPEPTSAPADDYEPMGTGLPMPRLPRPEAPGIASGTGLPDPGPLRLPNTGQQVYESIQQKLLAAGRKPIEANAMARIWRQTYDNFARKVGVDAYSLYKSANLDIRGPKNAEQVGAAVAATLNQDPLEARHYSMFASALERAPMKNGTGQQWLNYLKKQGVKDEELVWTGVMDGLERYKNEKLTPDILAHWFKNMAPAVYEAKPVEQGKSNHYGEWTLGGYGNRPESNYREVVLGLEQLPEGTYKSPHYGMVPNAVAHYRTTDRNTSDGKKVLLAEEFQSDAHQQARKMGYRTDDAGMEAAFARRERAAEALRIASGTGDSGAISTANAELNLADEELKREQQGVPNMPFKDTWPNLLFRHALFDAINSGKNYIAWPTGEQQADRYYDRGNPSYSAKLRGMESFYDRRMVDYANKLGRPYGSKVEPVTLASGETVHALPITPMMRELIGAGGLPLFQRKQGTPQGNITILPDKQIIRLFKTANESTFLHESMHHFLEMMQRLAPHSRDIAHDLQTLRDFVGNKGGRFTRDQHEKVARAWEQYFRTGKAPSKSLADIFKQFAEWLKKIYQRATDLGVVVTPEVQGVFDRLLADSKMDYKNATMERSSPLGVKASPGETYVQDRRKSMGARNRHVSGADSSLPFDEKSQAAIESVVNTTRGGDTSYLLSFDKLHERANILESYAAKAEARGETATARRWRSEADSLRRRASFLKSRGETLDQSPIANQTSNWNVLQEASRRTKAFFDPFSEVPQEATYRDIRNLMTGGVYQAEQSALKAKKLFDKLPLAQKDVVNTYFETPAADPLTLPASVRTEAVALKKYINGPLRQALIDNNLLPETALHTYDDSYLPRLYLKHLLSEEYDAKGGARLSKPYAKKRMDKTPEQLIAMGEVKDPGVRAFHALFRTQRDLAVMDFLDKVAANEDWALPQALVPWNGKKVTPFWLMKEADAIEETRIPAEPNPDRKALMKAEADRMRAAGIAGMQALNKADFDAKLYEKLPDTPEFGPLRGMIVRKQIAQDIIGTNNFVDPNNTFDKWFGDRNSLLTRAVSHWKALKVPMNLPSQVRNIASNLVLLNLSGVPIHMVGPRMYQAAREMLNNGPYYQIAKKYGVGKGTFSEQELFAINDDLRKLETSELSGFMGWRKIARAYLRIEKGASDLHGKMEEWGKVAKIIDAMQREGMSENDAVREANKWLFDYSEAVTFVKRARQSPLGMPFLTFHYKVLPLLYEIIRKHPTRLLPYIALAYTVPALVAAGNDISEDDAEALRKALSSNLRRKSSMYLLPYKDDAGRWQFVDMGYFMPWQMPFEIGKSMQKGAGALIEGDSREAAKEFGAAFKATSLLSNPILNVTAALTTGIDPFTERPIADKRDPMQKQVADIVAYAWSLSAPSILASYGALGKLVGRETGTGENKYGEPSDTYGQIAARALGVNLYPIVPDAQRARNIQYMQREIQDIKARMTNSLRDQSLTSEQRRRVAKNFQEEIQDRTKNLVKYVKESQPSERLRAATARP